MHRLHSSDYIVFIACLIFSLWLSYIAYKDANKTSKSILSYILMGRRLSLPFFVTTLVSTWYGGIFGVTTIAFESGIYNFFTQGVFWYISYLFMAFFLVHKIKATKAITLPELVEIKFGYKSGKLAAIFNLFNIIPITYTISLGLLLYTLFGGNMYVWMLIGILTLTFYTSLSGFRAIVYTDTFQFVLMCLAVVFVLVFSIEQYGGLSFLQMSLPPHYFQITSNLGWLETLSWAFIALSTLIDPNFYQRIFAADSSKTAKRGIIIATMIWMLFDLCTTFGAMYARAVMVDADSANAYMHYALELLPNGLRGLFLAGLLATIISTLDSYLFVAGNTLSYDILGNKVRTRWIHRFSMLWIGLCSIFLAYFFDGNIKEVWKTLGSYSAGALLIPVLYSFYFKNRISDLGFIKLVLVSSFLISLERYFFASSLDLYLGMLCSLLGVIYYHLIAFKFCKK